MNVSEPDRTLETGHRTGDNGRAHGGLVRYVTAREAADLIGRNERTIRRAIANGRLRAVKHRGVFWITMEDLEAWQQRSSPRRSTTPVAHPSLGLALELPVPVTPLVGREQDVAMATGILRRDDVRLLTLTGPGGIGKTRLAVEVATQLRADFVDGVHLVALADVRDPASVVEAIANRLDVPEGPEALAALRSALRNARALLVLDNFEHVMGAAPAISQLLGSCPHLKVLVTSTSLLRIGGEYVLPVPPLALPERVGEPGEDEAASSPAVQLFVDRVRAIRSSFSLTATNTSTVVAICHHLAGMPLAIELAASQTTVLSPEALLDRIEAQLPLPVSGPRDAPDRQRTMASAIAWTYGLLSLDEQRLFRWLGVFAAGFTFDAAQAVSRAVDITRSVEHDRSGDVLSGPELLATFAALVDASLIHDMGQPHARYAMLEPIRTFALKQLALTGELELAYRALRDWCLVLVERGPMAANVSGGEQYLACVDVEYANIRRSLEWLHERGDSEHLLRLAVALGAYWYERNHYREGRMWTERALAAASGGEESTRGRAAVQLGLFLSFLGDPARGRELGAEGMASVRRDDEPQALLLARIWEGAIAMQCGAYGEAELAFLEVLNRAKGIPNASISAAMSARAMSNLGTVSHVRGDLDDALYWHRMALEACREHAYLIGTLRALSDMADVARDRGDHAASLAWYQESVSMLGERSDRRVVIDAMVGIALAAASWGDGEQAARLLGAAARLAEMFSVPMMLAADRTARERAMREARALISEGRFEQQFLAGRRLTLEEAIAEMLACTGPDRLEPELLPSDVPLSRREREVLRLLAMGLRDRQIAESLFISVRTVEGHVARIMAKLGAPTRVAAAVAARRSGLIKDDR